MIDSRWTGRRSWRETAVLTAGGAAILGAINWKAFESYFFAEAFVYLGSYRHAGNSFWGAVFSPHGHVFFRPVLWALNLPWNLVLPPDPLLYHWRNFMCIVVTILVFHRLLLRMVEDRWSRVLAIGYYAVSRVHFTTIGYVATLSTIYVLLLTLLSMLFFLRWTARKRTLDYGLALLFVAMSIGSKDYGIVVLAPLITLAWWKRREVGSLGRNVVRWGLPLGIMLVVYFAIRLSIMGHLPEQGPYKVRIEPRIAVQKTLVLSSTAANLALSDRPGVLGARGLPGLLVPGDSPLVFPFQILLLCAFVALVLWSAFSSIRAGPLLLVPVVWALAFYLPTYVTRNIQMYYCNDAVAATALLIGICASRLSTAKRFVWSAVIVLLGLNAAVSGVRSNYTFQQFARRTAPLESAAKQYRNSDLDRIVFVGRKRGMWSFALTADGLSPMVQELFGDPDLAVTVVDPDHLSAAILADPRTLTLDADRQFERVTLAAAPQR